jgi:hypothetical protein
VKFVIYSEHDVLISRHTVANSDEKWAIVKAAKKEHGRIKVYEKELPKDQTGEQ